MTINVSWRDFTYYAFCATQIVTLAARLALMAHAVSGHDWSDAGWQIGGAAFAALLLYAASAARLFVETYHAVSCEQLRGHTAQATVAETMLRHMNEASHVEIGIAAEDDDDEKAIN